MRLTGYRIEQPIGRGGMATVYRAVQESLQRPVALKVLSPAFAGDEEFTTRFINEGRLVASLNHSNVVTIYDIDAQEGRHFIAMEYLPGGDLRSRMKSGLDVASALEHVAVIAGVLEAAHARHIVHRDVKPANVLFRDDGTLVLSDFGIAKHLLGDSDLTLPGSTLGSPYYLSPEQARGMPVDGRADVYSLGVMCFEMLTGARPYSGQSEIDVALKHVTDPVPRLPDRLLELQPLIDRMLAKSPEDRFHSAALAAEAVRSAREAWVTPEPGPVISANEDVATVVLPPTQPPCPPAPGPASSPRSAPEGPAVQPSAIERADRVAGALFGAVSRAAAGLLGDRASPSSGPEPSGADGAGPGVAGASSHGADDSSADVRDEVRRLVHAASRAVDEHRLASPDGDCAHHYVEQALDLDPDDVEAHALRRRIVERHAALAQAYLARLDVDEAGHHVGLGLELEPDDPTLQSLASLVGAVWSGGRRPGDAATASRESTTATTEQTGRAPTRFLSRIERLFESE